MQETRGHSSIHQIGNLSKYGEAATPTRRLANPTLLGAMCRVGFVIEDLTEPMHAEESAAPDTFAHRSQYLPTDVRLRARRIATENNSQHPTVWLPTGQ